VFARNPCPTSYFLSSPTPTPNKYINVSLSLLLTLYPYLSEFYSFKKDQQIRIKSEE